MQSNDVRHSGNTDTQGVPDPRNPWLEAFCALLEFLALRDDPPWLKAFKFAVIAVLIYLLVSNGYDVAEWLRVLR